MERGFARKRGSTWTAYYYARAGDGSRRQYSKGGFPTKRDAQGYLNRTIGTIEAGEFIEPQKLTFGDYLTERWLPIMEHSLRPSTFDSYQRVIRTHVLPAVGAIPLQRLTADHLDRLYRELLAGGRHDGKPGGLAPKSIRYIHTTLHKALRDAQRKGLVTRNVADAADPPKLSQQREMKTWTAGQVREFLEGLGNHRMMPAYYLAVVTGMRRGEVLGVRWTDLDLIHHRLSVRQTVLSVNYQLILGEPKTNRSRRPIALDPATLAVLQAHRRLQDDDKQLVGAGYHDHDLIFATEDGRPIHPDYYSQFFDRTVIRLGLPKIRLHDLRHTHATLGLAAGVHPKIMSERLGHATVAFTQDRYTHVIPQMENEAAEQIYRLIFPSRGNGA